MLVISPFTKGCFTAKGVFTKIDINHSSAAAAGWVSRVILPVDY
jgi:hypothetical protein